MSDDLKEVPITPVSEVKETKKEDVTKMSDNDIKWRAKYKLAKEEHENFKVLTEKEKSEISSKLENTYKERQVYEKKYIEAEMKAHAVAAGIKDLDLVKLIDTASIKIDDQGNVSGIKEALDEFKTRKPDFFGSDKKISTSTGAKFPEDTKTVPTDARKMSKEDWLKNKPRYMMGHIS